MENWKKKFYKDGDPDIHRKFNKTTWDNLTDHEKAHWTEYSDLEHAPISKEVIDFKASRPDLKEKTSEIEALKSRVTELEGLLEACKKDPSCCKDQKVKKAEAPKDEKKLIQEELRKMGVKFAYNAGVKNLKEKLKKAKADANN